MVQKATQSLEPLHRPGIDSLPDFSRYMRQPMPAQADVIAAAVKMMDESPGVIASEMGTGKTIMGAMIIDQHAARSGRKGGRNGKYRAVVLCPDHLITKWQDEIERTIPSPEVAIFDAKNKSQRHLLKDMIKLYDKLRGPVKGHWPKPTGPEWFILGHNQAKFLPLRKAAAWRDRELIEVKGRKEVVPRDRCPDCGRRVTNGNGGGTLVKNGKNPMTCDSHYGRQVADPEIKQQGLIRTAPWRKKADNPLDKPGRTVEKNDVTYKVHACGCKLWQFTGKIKRWPPALFFPRKLRAAFHYLVVDEIHETKSDQAAKAVAAARLIAAIPNVLKVSPLEKREGVLVFRRLQVLRCRVTL
jgi:hypothetical protein